VGGSLRDALLGRPEFDWDIATSARPERLLELFPGSRYENRFGTVLVMTGEGPVEVTTFRSDHTYADHRRPDAVTFTDSLELDLGRRDFTVNALAWGREGGVTGPLPRLVDLSGGMDDLRDGLIRAVGDPGARFDEDALRLVRAARLAGQLGFAIEPTTRKAMERLADHVRHVSPERIGQELRKLLRGDRPSRGLRLLADTGLLDRALPELVVQRGLPQDKAPGADCWEHTLATVDAAAALSHGGADLLPLAALFHDAGKPRALADGRFPEHQEIGAEITDRALRRLAFPRQEIVRVVRLVRNHMFRYEPSWKDAAVRRFVQRVGPDLWDDLLRLREADTAGSGGVAADPGLAELRARIERELERGFPLGVTDLAVDGDDLRREFDLPEGPLIGRLLARLLDSCTADPSRNTRHQGLIDARSWLPDPDGNGGSPGGAAAR
jgi:tRNA nucleotidyltransferase/poly(A) polymerase